jgi:hypothetical protein
MGRAGRAEWKDYLGTRRTEETPYWRRQSSELEQFRAQARQLTQRLQAWDRPQEHSVYFDPPAARPERRPDSRKSRASLKKSFRGPAEWRTRRASVGR